MTFLGVMSFVKDQEIDLTHLHEAIKQALVENFSSADNDHIFSKIVIPDCLVPEVRPHGSENVCHILVQVVLQYSRLLVHKSHAVRLLLVSD